MIAAVALTALALAALACYLLGVARLRRRNEFWPAVRTVAFLAGAGLAAATGTSGALHLGDRNFSAWAFLYGSCGLLAPLLLCLGAPFTLRSRTKGRPAASRPPPAARLLTFPGLCEAAYATSLFVLLFTGVARATLRSWEVASVVGAGAVLLGFWYWYPAVGADPLAWRMDTWRRSLYLLLLFPVFTIAGMGLESQRTSLAPALSLASMHLGAAVLWIIGDTFALAGVLAVFVAWLKAEQQAAVARDREHEAAAARQLALWRAAREAARRAVP